MQKKQTDMWLGGVLVRMLDLRSQGCGFDLVSTWTGDCSRTP